MNNAPQEPSPRPTEFALMAADTTRAGFEQELRWNAAYHRLARGL